LQMHIVVCYNAAMLWCLSNRCDILALPLADRHYNRQKIGSPQFVPPGRCIVLLTPQADALWVSSWPLKEFTKHAWSGAWINTLFRNESDILSSILIQGAVAITRGIWGDPPRLGMVTFIDKTKVKKKRDWGRCYRRAGFIPAQCPIHYPGVTRDCASCRHETSINHLFAVQMLPTAMPEPKYFPSLFDYL